MAKLPGGIVDSDHPMVKETINKMVREGYESSTIQRVVGVDAATVDAAMLRHERGADRHPARRITDGEVREKSDHMAKMRAAKAAKKSAGIAEKLKSS